MKINFKYFLKRYGFWVSIFTIIPAIGLYLSQNYVDLPHNLNVILSIIWSFLSISWFWIGFLLEQSEIQIKEAWKVGLEKGREHELNDLLKDHEEQLQYSIAEAWDNGYREGVAETESYLDKEISREKEISYDEGYNVGYDDARGDLVGF